MTIDKTLKVKKGGGRTGGVLSRGARIARLKELERWKEGDPVLGLPKVRVIKLALKKKKKAKAEGEGDAPAAGGAAAPAAAPAKKEAAAKKK